MEAESDSPWRCEFDIVPLAWYYVFTLDFQEWEEKAVGKNFNKWHFLATVVLLYALVVVIALFTHQSPETMSMLLDKGAPGIGFLCFLILIFG